MMASPALDFRHSTSHVPGRVPRSGLCLSPGFPDSCPDAMPRDDHFGMFQAHTRLKHFLLEVYLKQWASILIAGRTIAGVIPPRMLWFVDAFAGAGRDEQGTPGSPLIAAEIAIEINKTHYVKPGKTSGMRVLAIEADQGRYEQLSEALQPYSAVAEVRHGSLQDIIGKVMPFLEQHDAPALFFLDPFGVHGLDATLLPQIFRVKRTEILLLFSDEGAVRLAGKAEAKVPTRAELLARRQDGRLSFGGETDAKFEEQDRLDVEKILAGHSSNSRAAEILNSTFGGKDWRAIVERTPAPQRRQAFVNLYMEVLTDSGAKYVLPFAVTTEQGRHKYTLIHASTHSSAFAAMKDAMHRAHKQRAANQKGTISLGYLASTSARPGPTAHSHRARIYGKWRRRSPESSKARASDGQASLPMALFLSTSCGIPPS